MNNYSINVFKNRRRSLNQQRGLTLVEIVIVIAILSILIGYLTSTLFAKGANSKAQINLMKMKRLKSAINQYQLMNNSLPPNLDALVNCTGNNGQACFPVAQADDIVDIFGTPYQYSGGGSGNTYTIKSLGNDKRDGGTGADADVTETGP